jgi:peptide deformylase
VKRSEWVKVKGLNREGREVRLRGEGLLAQALEHEIDHINGILYVDRLESRETLVPVSQVAKDGDEGTESRGTEG